MKKLKNIKNWNWKRIIGVVVFLTLAFSIVYSIFKIIAAPSEAPAGDEYVNTKSDYTLMLIQCCLGLAVILLPDLLEKKFSFDIPNYMFIMFYVFLYCAIYLGEVRDFFYLFDNWDTVLHAFSGAMLGALGLLLVRILNESDRVLVSLSPFFVALFAFCFALATGALWEIYEFAGDGLLGLNMQKFRLADGTQLIGHAALADTMGDLIIDTIGAFVISAFGYITLRKKKLQPQVQ